MSEGPPVAPGPHRIVKVGAEALSARLAAVTEAGRRPSSASFALLLLDPFVKVRRIETHMAPYAKAERSWKLSSVSLRVEGRDRALENLCHLFKSEETEPSTSVR